MNEELLAAGLRQLVVTVVREVLPEVLAEHLAKLPRGDELLTTTEAASIAKVRRSTIYTWLHKHRLKSQRVGPGGRALRIRRADLETFLARGGARRRPAPESPDAAAEEWARQEVARTLAKRADRPSTAGGLRLVGKP